MSGARASFYIFCMKIIGAGCAFLVTVIFIRFLNEEGLGQYALIMTLVAVLSVLSSYGQGVRYTKALASGSAIDFSMAFSFRKWMLLISIAICLLVSIFVATEMAVFACALLAYNFFSQMKSPFFMSKGYFVFDSFFNDFLRPFLGVVFAIISAIFFFYLGALDASYLLSSMIVILVVFPVSMRLYKYAVSGTVVEKIPFRRSLSEASQGHLIVIVGLLGILVGQFDRIYVSVLLGMEEAGIYYAAVTISMVVSYFNQAVIARKVPLIVRLYEIKAEAQLQTEVKTASIYSLLFSIISIFSFVAFYPFIEFVMGVNSGDVFSVVVVILSAQAISLFFGFGSTLMLYSDDLGQKILAIFLVISFFMSVAVGSFLVMKYGVIGAALGTGLGIIINRALPYIYYRKNGYRLGIL